MQKLPKKARYVGLKVPPSGRSPKSSLKIFGEQFGLSGDCYADIGTNGLLAQPCWRIPSPTISYLWEAAHTLYPTS